MGLGLLIGSAVPKGRSVWLYSSLAILLAVMVVQYDPGLHGGHMDLIVRPRPDSLAAWRLHPIRR